MPRAAARAVTTNRLEATTRLPRMSTSTTVPRAPGFAFTATFAATSSVERARAVATARTAADPASTRGARTSTRCPPSVTGTTVAALRSEAVGTTSDVRAGRARTIVRVTPTERAVRLSMRSRSETGAELRTTSPPDTCATETVDAAGPAYDAHRTTVEVARAQGRRDREVRALANAYNASTHVGPEASASVVRELEAAADPSDPVQLARRDAVLGFDDLNADRTPSGRAHLESAMDRIESDDLLARSPDLLQLTVQAVMWSGRTERLRPQITAVVSRLAAQGDLRLLPSTLRGLAWCDYAGGRWQSAAELADQALDLSRVGDRAVDVCESLSQVAVLEGARGHVGTALVQAAESRALALELGSSTRLVDACWAECLALLGVVDLARLDEAAPRFAEAVRGLHAGQQQPEYYDAPVALAVAGRHDDARRLLDELVAGTDEDQRPESRVGALLCRLHLDADSTGLAADAAALADDLVGDDDYAFGRARLRLAAGAMTRRLGARTDARALLRAAEQDFEALGAAPWLERTRDELRASGATLRSAATPEAGLTAAEARVCRAAATGMSTKEIAAALFLSPKTVEFHLGRIFRKLGVKSRAELVSVLAARAQS